MNFPEFINEFQPSFPEEETLDHRTWPQLGRAIQGLDVKGTEKIDSNAFQICKELKTVIDKKRAQLTIFKNDQEKAKLMLGIEGKLEPEDILSSVSV